MKKQTGMQVVGAVFVAALSPLSLLAVEPGELITDRPDATESSSTVAPGYVQYEIGWTHFEDEDKDGLGARGDSFPETLLRIGLVEDLELRLGYTGYNWVHQEQAVGGSKSRDFSGEPEIGFKVRLAEEEGAMPEIALMSHLEVPAFSSKSAEPSYRFAFSHTLSEDLSLVYNLGQAFDTDGGDLFQYTAALGLGLSEKWGVFAEFFGDIPTGNDSADPANTFGGGLTYLWRENVQLDVLAGVGLSESADDWFIGTGISFRLPN